MVSREDYRRAVEELVRVIAEEFGDAVVAVYVAGSFARGDFLPGRSDVDVYVVLSRDGEVSEGIRRRAKEIERRYLSEVMDYNPEPLGVTMTTLEEVKSGRSWLGMGWEYHIFQREGRLLYGRDIRGLIPRPSREEEVEMAKAFLRKLNKRYEVNRLFHLVFRSASIFLSTRGVYVASKRRVVEEFKRLYPGERASRLLERALELWNTWGARDLADEEIVELFKIALEVTGAIQRLIED
ncbi:MAG: hypothetical protein DRK00_04350 [Thermoprotei archaeon]|nr:MAG: hypothetical protein DRK00_04350 [Thermoprotei archaeon]